MWLVRVQSWLSWNAEFFSLVKDACLRLQVRALAAIGGNPLDSPFDSGRKVYREWPADEFWAPGLRKDYWSLSLSNTEDIKLRLSPRKPNLRAASLQRVPASRKTARWRRDRGCPCRQP